MALPSTIAETFALHPKPDIELRYGTAGFRLPAELLDSTFLRMGVLAKLRAIQQGATVGLMVTASHNPIKDNGIKLVDPDGGMLAQSWEAHATALANAGTPADAVAVICSIACAENIAMPFGANSAARVMVARDTRPHSARLATLACSGVASLGQGMALDLGVMTTPQLHHCVRTANHADALEQSYPLEAGYYRRAIDGFLALVATAPPGTTPSRAVVDCANGVGGPKLAHLLEMLETTQPGAIRAEVRNAGLDEASSAKLNLCVGAEHVQKQRKLPRETVDEAAELGVRFASFDGDADRVVFFYLEPSSGSLQLLDGDKIMALLAGFVKRQLERLPRALELGESTVCAVQTAYANGASSRYLRDKMGLEVALVKTGVKHLHHKAAAFDVGAYFEANGHGTILFSERLVRRLRHFLRVAEGRSTADAPGADVTPASEAAAAKLGPDEIVALRRLCALTLLINQATGDAIADFLAVEAVLMVENLDVAKWQTLYQDLPSRMLKVRVADRTVIQTTSDETRALAPATLQPAVDRLVEKVEQGRAFVRPSGTEDVVRVYAEAMTQEQADALAHAVSCAAFDHAGGVGERPTE